MIGKTAQIIFTRVFVMMILNFYFFVFSVMGLLILGVGPALQTVNELFLDHQWHWQGYRFKQGWHYYRQYFVKANCHFWLFAGMLGALLYNLYLSTQINQPWILVIQFVLLMGIMMTVVIGLLFMAIQARYAVNLKHGIVLAFAQFFDHPLQILRFIFGIVTMVIVCVRWPGLGLFLSVGAVIVWTNWSFQKWYQRVDAMFS